MEAINPIERAMALAASGRFKTASQVRALMLTEGYPRSMIYPLFEGASFLKTIRAAIKSAPPRSGRTDGAEHPKPAHFG